MEQQYNDEQVRPVEEQRPRGRMNRRAVTLTIILFLVLVGGMFIFAYMQNDRDDARVQNDDMSEEEDRFALIDMVNAKHFYEDGVHTLAGEIAMPTPCDLLEADARVAESMPEQVTVDFTVVNNAEFCAQTVTNQRFMVSVTASEEATFSATFEGRPIQLNLIDPAPGETPEDFELFIKG